MQASRALKIRGMKPEYIVITRYVSKPSISINARQMHFGRKIQVSKTHRFLEPNQIKKKKRCKRRGLLFDFQNEGSGDPHQQPWLTLNMDNFVKLLSLYPKEKRKSQSYFYGTSEPQMGPPKEGKAADQVNQNDYYSPSRCRWATTTVKIGPSLQPYSIIPRPTNQTFLALGNFRGYN